MDQRRIDSVATKLKAILGPDRTPEYRENLAALHWVVANFQALIGLEDTDGTASWSNERTLAAREFLIHSPIVTRAATTLLCKALGQTLARNFKRPEIAAYASSLAEWALSPSEELQSGITLAMAHNEIDPKVRWTVFLSMMGSGFFRLQFIMPAMIASSAFFDVQSDIWEILYSCLPNFRSAFPRIRNIVTPIGDGTPLNARTAGNPIRVGAWSHKFGGFLSSATTVHPWLMNLEEPGLEVYMLSERRTNDPVQQRYREIYGSRFIDCDGKSDEEFVATARSLDLDVLIMVHPTRTAYAQMQRIARCHLDYHGMHRPYAAPDQTLINIGALDLAFAESTGRNMIVIPDPPFVHTPRPFVELKDRTAADEFCFGAFNRALKFNAHLLDVWARILQECPKSSLFIAFLQADFFTEHIVKSEMAARGVNPTRIKIAPPVSHVEHLNRHNSIDIMLDTFPVGAGMTAVDTFDMGVPLLSLSGDYRPCALQTRSVIALVGKEAGLYADNEEAYVAYAKARYAEGPRSKARRQVLRDATKMTPIFDFERYTRFMRKVVRVAAEGAREQLTYIFE